MAQKIDLTGNRYGRLVVLGRSPRRSEKDFHSQWACRCDCGNVVAVQSTNLQSGHTKSCGCYKKDRSTAHGRSGERLYEIYFKIKTRCYNPKDKHYDNYGGRGIVMCDEWGNDFQSFYNWAVENGYSDELSIDRINGNGNYEPSNCRWATKKEQQNNTRRNRFFTLNGKTKTVAEWADETGINYNTLRARLCRYGWSAERALTEGVNNGI